MNTLKDAIEKLKALLYLSGRDVVREYLLELTRVSLYDMSLFDTPDGSRNELLAINKLIGKIDLWPCEYCGYNQDSYLSELGNASLNDWSENNCTSCQVIDWQDGYENRVHTSDYYVSMYIQTYLGQDWQDKLKKWLDEN